MPECTVNIYTLIANVVNLNTLYPEIVSYKRLQCKRKFSNLVTVALHCVASLLPISRVSCGNRVKPNQESVLFQF